MALVRRYGFETAAGITSCVGIDEVVDAGRTMIETSACGLGMAAPLITTSLLKYFPERVSDHVTGQT